MIYDFRNIFKIISGIQDNGHQNLMNCKGCIFLYFTVWDTGISDVIHIRGIKFRIQNFRKSKVENQARYYVIHKCFRSYLKIQSKGNHILKFNYINNGHFMVFEV